MTDNLWSRSERLYYYIKENLYSDSIAIQTKGKIIAFAWSFELLVYRHFHTERKLPTHENSRICKEIEDNLKKMLKNLEL